MILNEIKIKNIFKEDDKKGQFLIKVLNDMVNHLNPSRIEGIYINPYCIQHDYLRGIAYIDVEFKGKDTDSEFNILFDAETKLRDTDIDCVISPNDVDGHYNYIKLL